MSTLALAMIVKDEEKNLRRCLETVEGCFDEIVIVDTGSADRTKEIAASFNAKIHDFAWIDDFSAARNFAFSKASSDFVMWLDADDIVKPEEKAKLKSLRESLGTKADAYYMKYDYAQDENGKSTLLFSRERIIRNTGDAKWVSPIHECMVLPESWKKEFTDITITHRRSVEDCQKDSGRNLRLLRKGVVQNPKDARLQFYFARELGYSGHHEESIGVFEDYLTKEDWHENRVNAHLGLANAYSNLNRPEKAIDVCLRGIQLDHRWADFYTTIGQIYYDRKDWTKAIFWFDQASRCSPPESIGFVNLENYTWIPQDRLCVSYWQLGQYAKADECNEKALAYKPTEPRLINNREAMRNVMFPGRQAERPLRLNLGGTRLVPGYRNASISDGPGVSERFSPMKIPYADSTIHAILSDHALERAGSHTASLECFREWARVLRPQGELTLRVSDLDRCCEKFVLEPDQEPSEKQFHTPKEWYRSAIFGSQSSIPTRPQETDFKYTGFTKQELSRLLIANGFKVEEISAFDHEGVPSIEVKARLVSKFPRVRWIVSSKQDVATRTRRIPIERHLTRKGYDAKILVRSDYGGDENKLYWDLRNSDVVIVTSGSKEDRALIERLRRTGIGVIYDLVGPMPGDMAVLDDCLRAANMVVCASPSMLPRAMTLARSIFVGDPVEDGLKTNSHEYARNGNEGHLRVGVIENEACPSNIGPVKPMIESLDMDLVALSDGSGKVDGWAEDRFVSELAKVDILVAPEFHWKWPDSSAWKVVQAQSLGIPVIASPLESFKNVIREGETGFICETLEDWNVNLKKLRDDVLLREKIGRSGRLAMMKYFSPDAIGQRWISAIDDLAKENASPPKVDVIIPTYNNLKYLKPCIESIRRQTDWPYNLVVVDSGDDETYEWLQGQSDITVIRSKTRLNYAQAVNLGIRETKERYVLLLNNDTIVSHHWLSALMAQAMKPRVGAVGPFSNCDKGFSHEETIVIGGKELKKISSLEDVSEILPEIEKYSHPKNVVERFWIAFYAVLIPREIIEKVGLLDENFKNGHEDLDYCKRVRKAGYRIENVYDSFIYHFYMRTARPDPIPEMDKHNQARTGAKYDKPLFVIYTGAAWEAWNGDSLEKEGLGGSETAAIYIARAFEKKGYRPVVFADCKDKEGVIDGVEYLDYRRFDQWADSTHMDIFVSSRRPEIFSKKIRADYKLCFATDTVFHGSEINMEKIDRFIAISLPHSDLLVNRYKIPASKMFISRCGVDLDRFRQIIPRQKAKLIYASAPNRGLDILLELFPKIRKEFPEATLHIFYGWNYLEAAANQWKDAALKEFIDKTRKAFEQPGVIFRGRVPLAELTKELLSSSLWAYPTYFHENFCISALEAMAAGVPVITSDYAAMPSTVGDAGILIEGDPRSESYKNRFLDECLLMLRDQERWKTYSAKGRERAQAFPWSTIADEWLEIMKQDLEAKKASN